ncbi:MAG: purine-nucleoside phosphorylase [Lachnospiraceae bacterium]|nr:purine-nucleoside phosphorylase [Lachnospiraceae bacterium]
MSDFTPTPHNRAKKGDFAETVLMPGDPLRAKFIAETYLEDAKLVTDVRNMLGYTGTYNGKKVSVMGGGMGMPSIGIYSHELYNFYDVKKIIRIGSAGAINEKCKINDIVIAQGACTESNWAAQYHFNGTFAPIADWSLLSGAAAVADKQGTKYVVGNVLSEDAFYNADPHANEPWIRMGVLCVEMETAALYMEAAASGKQALSILTISDELYSGKALSSDERQTTFRKMMELALELA